jgi:hypothetical protein
MIVITSLAPNPWHPLGRDGRRLGYGTNGPDMPDHRWVSLFPSCLTNLIFFFKGNDEGEEDSDRELPTRKKRPRYSVEFNEDGYPILPNPEEEEMKLMEMEQLIRVFLTTYYRMSYFSSACYILTGSLQRKHWEIRRHQFRGVNFREAKTFTSTRSMCLKDLHSRSRPNCQNPRHSND